MVEISGTVTGLLDTGHDVTINVVDDMYGDYWQGPSDGTFTVSVASGEPFVLQAVEWLEGPAPESGQGYTQEMFQWMQQGFDGTTEPIGGLELDFAAHAMETFTADVTTGVPDREDSPVCAGYGACNVCDFDSYNCQGWSTSVDISEDGTEFETSYMWVEPEYSEDSWHYCAAYDAETWALLSYNIIEGYPVDGSFLGTLLDVPEWVSPLPGDAHPMYEPLEWAQFEDGPLTMLNLYRLDDFVWQILMAPNETSLTIPQPPSTFDQEILEGPGNVRVELLVANIDFETNQATEIAFGDALFLSP
jgi:hypothetical protein